MKKIFCTFLVTFILLLPFSLVGDSYGYNPFTGKLDILGAGSIGGGATISGTDNQFVLKSGSNGVTKAFPCFDTTGTNIEHDGTCFAELGENNVYMGNNDFSAANKTSPVRIGSIDPAACTASIREFFFNTTTNTLKSCNADNVWTAISESSGGTTVDWISPTINSTNTNGAHPGGTFFGSGWALGGGNENTAIAYWNLADEAANTYAVISGVVGSTITNLDATMVYWSSGAFGGDIKFRAAGACTAIDGTLITSTPSFTMPAYTTITPSATTSNTRRNYTFSNLLNGLTCNPTDIWSIKIERGLNADGDGTANPVRVSGIQIKITR